MQAIVFSSEHGGFGYNIFVNDVLVIHQPHVPVVRGMQGFASHKEAQDVAALVIKKMKSGVIPPVITLEEMQTLSVRL